MVAFVEDALLDSRYGPTAEQLDRLERLKSDLRAEALDACSWGGGVRWLRAPGWSHASALRDLLKDFRDRHRQLAGTLLIGGFPEATIVHRFPWIIRTAKDQEFSAPIRSHV